jgi:hypothetical protein
LNKCNLQLSPIEGVISLPQDRLESEPESTHDAGDNRSNNDLDREALDLFVFLAILWNLLPG